MTQPSHQGHDTCRIGEVATVTSET